jgi:hypothetical protein
VDFPQLHSLENEKGPGGFFGAFFVSGMAAIRV